MNFDYIEVGDTVKVEDKRYSGVVKFIGQNGAFCFAWVRTRNVEHCYIEHETQFTVIKKGNDSDTVGEDRRDRNEGLPKSTA